MDSPKITYLECGQYICTYTWNGCMKMFFNQIWLCRANSCAVTPCNSASTRSCGPGVCLPSALFCDLSGTRVNKYLSSKGFSFCKVNRRNGHMKSAIN